MDDQELIEAFLDEYRYSRKVVSNDGTPQISVDEKVSKKFVGFTIGDKVWVDLRYSRKHDAFYWTIYPDGDQPSPENIREEILEVIGGAE